MWAFIGMQPLRSLLMEGWRSSCFVGNSVGLFNGGLYCCDIGFVSSVDPFRHESCITLTGWPANSCLCVRSSGNGLNSACTPNQGPHHECCPQLGCRTNVIDGNASRPPAGGHNAERLARSSRRISSTHPRRSLQATLDFRRRDIPIQSSHPSQI